MEPLRYCPQTVIPLGGDDFDNVVVDWMVDTFKKENGVDLRKDTMAMQRLKEAGEKAKKDLSGVVQTQISSAVYLCWCGWTSALRGYINTCKI